MRQAYDAGQVSLADWLLERIGLEEIQAREVASLNGQHWKASVGAYDDHGVIDGDPEDPTHSHPGPGYPEGELWDSEGGYLAMHIQTAEYVARHDPARVLAECEAKRRIVEHANECSDGGSELSMDFDDERGLALVLRLLALPYADCDGFREEWRP
jgi:hypothetical protein